jgi:cbb3-type cytochrome oxidase subunit 3
MISIFVTPFRQFVLLFLWGVLLTVSLYLLQPLNKDRQAYEYMYEGKSMNKLEMDVEL